MTVYLVTRGEYSDYRICAAYSTRELAGRALSLFSDSYSEPQIEEWELDRHTDLIRAGCRMFCVYMYRDGGSQIYPSDPADPERTEFIPKRGKEESSLYVILPASSKEEAVKIVNERRIRMIAEGGW